MMKIKYDTEVDALYIALKAETGPVTTVRINEDVAIDLGPSEEMVGIEILSASEHMEFVQKKPMIAMENLSLA